MIVDGYCRASTIRLPPCRTFTLPLIYAPSYALPIVQEALSCTVMLSLMIPTKGFRAVLLQLTSARAAEAPPSSAATANVNMSARNFIAWSSANQVPDDRNAVFFILRPALPAASPFNEAIRSPLAVARAELLHPLVRRIPLTYRGRHGFILQQMYRISEPMLTHQARISERTRGVSSGYSDHSVEQMEGACCKNLLVSILNPGSLSITVFDGGPLAVPHQLCSAKTL